MYKIREGWLAPFPWCEEFRFNLDNIFTRLKIVSRKKERGTKTRETVSMDDIFKPHEECPQPRTVLIEGNPGIGKTTYCNKLAYDWATKELEQGEETSSGGSFPNFKVALSLKCRDIKSDVLDAIEEQRLYGTPKEKEEELFKSLLWDAIDDQLLPRGVTKQEKEEFFKFVRHNQQGVLLVLDGVDELPMSLLPAFKEIIQGRMLPKCHIVVTARHEVGMKVRECCDTLLEMEGFTELDARNFIAKYFKTESHLARKLLDKIDFDDNLRQLTKSPLNTALLCLLCEDFDGVFPQSGTQLYLDIVECVLRRYRKKKGLPDPECEDLIDIYKTQLTQLGRIAWKGLLDGNLFFEKSEFENCADGLLEYGFLSVERGRSKRRPSLYYCFLHRTFQELFSAFYLCCDVVNNEHFPENLIPESKYFLEFRQVLAFTCGLLASQSEEMVTALVARIANNVNSEAEFLIALKCIGECKNEKNSTMHMSLACSLGSLLQVNQMDLSLKNFPFGVFGDWTTLAEVIKRNSAITHLNLSSNLLGLGDWTALAEAIKHNSTIRQLDLSENRFGVDDSNIVLADAIKHNSTMTHLNLSCNFFGLGDCTALAEAIKHNLTIRQLDLSGSCIGFGDCTIVLADAIKHNSTITHLNLSCNRLRLEGCTALAEAIKHNSTIRQLDLSGTNPGFGDCNIVLADAVKHNSTITHLNLSCNEFGGGFLTNLAEKIKHDLTKRQLDLSENGLGNVGLGDDSLGDDGLNDDACTDACTELAEAIKHNSTIIQLNLSKNHLSDGNFTVLADAIKHNSTIKQLDLSENGLGNVGLGDDSLGDDGLNDDACTDACTELAEAIKHNSTIIQLNLSKNHLSDGNFTVLADAIKRNSTIKQLDLSENVLGVDDCTPLADAIKNNSTITQLNLSSNHLGVSDCSALVEAIKHNSTITQLDLSCNFLPGCYLISLAEAVKHNVTMRQLDLSANLPDVDDCTVLAEAFDHNSTITELIL